MHTDNPDDGKTLLGTLDYAFLFSYAVAMFFRFAYQFCNIPYAYKFLRDVIFYVFMGNLSSIKIKSSNFFKTITMHVKLKG